MVKLQWRPVTRGVLTVQAPCVWSLSHLQDLGRRFPKGDQNLSHLSIDIKASNLRVKDRVTMAWLDSTCLTAVSYDDSAKDFSAQNRLE